MASIQRIHKHLLPFPPIRVEPSPGTTDEVSQHASPVHPKSSQFLPVSGRRSPRLGDLLQPTRTFDWPEFFSLLTTTCRGRPATFPPRTLILLTTIDDREEAALDAIVAGCPTKDLDRGRVFRTAALHASFTSPISSLGYSLLLVLG